MTSASVQRYSGLVATCVFLSGLASLALEVVWSRVLKLVFGSTTLAITTILVAYMLGLGLGGLWGGKFAARLRNGVRTYGWMEVGVGLYALCVPTILGFYPELNRAVLAPLGFWPAAFLRFGLVLVILLLPTLLMGATLPVLISALARSGEGLARKVGLLYGVNTLGAVAGVLGVTFVAFRVFGLAWTNGIAAGLDIVVGLAAVFMLAPNFDPVGDESPADADPSDAADPADSAAEGADAAASRAVSAKVVLASYGTVGFTALVYEIAWTRALTLILGSSVYAFATMLAGFLAGIALGSLLARRYLDRVARPEFLYAAGLFVLGACSLAVVFVFRALPDLFLSAFASVGISGSTLVWMGLGISFLVMLPPTLVLGALFPLSTRIVARSKSSARAVGEVYFVNTVGSATGAFCGGFLFVPSLGLQTTMALAIAVNFATAGLVVLWLGGRTLSPGRGLVGVAGLAGAVAAYFLTPSWRADDFSVGVYYRSSAQLDFGLPEIEMAAVGDDELLFYDEGVNCNVSVHRSAKGLEEGMLSMCVNGKTDASIADMSTQVLSGHLPVLFGAKPESALVIGYASGITAGALSLFDLETIDVAEIEPAVIEAAEYFNDYNHRPLEKDNVNLILNDGRTVLSTARETYDVIVSEPSNPWMTGCANLFTAEFFEEAHAALKPGGRLLQWIQLYGMDLDGLTSVLKALHESFDHAYGFLYDAGSTDLLILATDTPLTLDTLPRWEELSEPVREDLSRVRVFSTADLWSLVAFGDWDLRRMADTARVTNTDDSMFVELRAPWYIYDETPETYDSLRTVARGLFPVIEASKSEIPRDVLGELTVAYLVRRLDGGLARPPYAHLVELEDVAYRAIHDAEIAIYERGDHDPEARRLLDDAVAAAPNDFAPRYHRGRLLSRLGDFEQAEKDLSLALAVKPDHLEARFERMKVYGSLGKKTGSSTLLKKAYDEVSFLIESPLIETEPKLWKDGAFLSGGFGRLDEAIERTERFLELIPFSPDAWGMLASWHEANESPGARDAAYANAQLAFQTQVRNVHWLARWHENYGTKAEAILALQAALELDPKNAAVQADLTRLQAES